MTLPTMGVQIAFATNPTEATDWTDVSGYVRKVSIRRGRQDELGRVEAGTLNLTLDNRDRRFDPEYTTGPYYSNLLPIRRVRVQATFGGVTYDLFTGYIEGWPQSWADGGVDAVVELQASDGFKVLAMKKLTESYAAQSVDARVSAILDDAGWTNGTGWVLGSATQSQLGETTIVGPVGDRALDASISNVQAVDLSDQPALEHLQEVVEAEHGLFFVNASGVAVFHNRRWRIGNTWAYATFGDVAGELPYLNIKISHDDTEIWNEIKVTPADGTTQTATDATSQTKYFTRTLSKDNLPLSASDSEILSLAEWLLNTYKEPKLRVVEMEMNGALDDALWPHLLGRDIDDRILVHRLPRAGGNTIEQLSHIEGIQHDFVPGEFKTRWSLSPADATGYWQLGISGASELGDTTVLGY